MTRKQTPSYVLTLKLDTNNRDESILNKRLEEKVESQSMEKLRIHINEMLYSLQLRICTNINDISYAL